jgi:hypothetical protein
MSSQVAAAGVHPEHADLVRRLAELPESERRAVVAAATEQAEHRARTTLAALRAAAGIMKGAPCDALVDEQALYDG